MQTQPTDVPTGAVAEVRPLAERYAHIDFSPPEGVRDAARRSLEVRAEKPESQRGMTEVGIARARDLANGRSVSPETARRMLAYFTRHEGDKAGATWDEQGPGWQAWHAWGGDAGYAWARKLVEQMDAADDKADLGEAAMLGEAADYAVVGRPIRVLRLGPVHGRWDGERLVEVTDSLCAELVRVFEHRRANGDGVPIDWNHASEQDGPPEETGPLGEVLSLRHVPGDGLYAELGYSARGERIVRDATPALWTSPSFRVQPVYDKTTGERIGSAEMRAIALTPFPRQDRTDAVRLSDTPADCRNGGPAMVDTTMQSPAPAAGPVVQTADMPEPEMDLKAMLMAKDEEISALKAQLAALMEKMGAYEEAEKTATAEGASLAEVSRKVATLAEQSRKLEVALAEERKARASERLSHRLDAAQSAGWFAPVRRDYLVALAEKAPDLFEAEMARLSQSPEVPLGEVGHGKAPAPKPADPRQAAHEAIQAIMLAEQCSYPAAYARLKNTNPALAKEV